MSVLARTFSSLRSRNVRLYFGGTVVSQMGTWMQSVALPWLVLEITGSGVWLGLLYALQFVPTLLLGAWAGVIADRHDKRRLLMITTTLAGTAAAVLAVLTLLDAISLWSIVAITLALGTINAFDITTRRSFVVELVEPHETTNAISLFNAVFTMSRIIGPAIAGLCIVVAGVGWCFALNAASFGAVLIALTMMSPAGIHASVPIHAGRGQLRDGLRYAWREPLIRMAILMTFVVCMLAFNHQVVLPVFAERTFDGGASSFALMIALTGVGALMGALLTAHRGRVSGPMMAGSAVAVGFATGVSALTPTLFTAYLSMVPLGLTTMVFFTTCSAVVQERAGPDMRGRVTALFLVASLGSTPIGAPIVGAITQAFGPRAALAMGAGVAIITGFVGFMALRHRRRVSDSASPPRNSPIREPLQGLAG